MPLDFDASAATAPLRAVDDNNRIDADYARDAAAERTLMPARAHVLRRYAMPLMPATPALMPRC